MAQKSRTMYGDWVARSMTCNMMKTLKGQHHSDFLFEIACWNHYVWISRCSAYSDFSLELDQRVDFCEFLGAVWSSLGKLKFKRAQVSFGVCKQKQSQQTNSGKIEFIWTPSVHLSGIFKGMPWTFNIILESARGCSGDKVCQKTSFENSGGQSVSNDVLWR